MKRRASLVFVLAFVINLLVWVPCSSAQGPVDINEEYCEVLANTIIQVDAFLEAQGVTCANAGDLVSLSFTDPTFFSFLQELISVTSGSTIWFDSPQQMLSTIAKCQLMTLLIDECLDESP